MFSVDSNYCWYYDSKIYKFPDKNLRRSSADSRSADETQIQVDVFETSPDQQQQHQLQQQQQQQPFSLPLPTTVQIFPLPSDTLLDQQSNENVMCLSIVNGQIQNIRNSVKLIGNFTSTFSSGAQWEARYKLIEKNWKKDKSHGLNAKALLHCFKKLEFFQ